MADREKVINELNNLPKVNYCGFYHLRITHSLRDEIVKLLKEQEQLEELEERLAIVLEGQQEIVRCKDCKRKEFVGDSEVVIYCPHMKLRTTVDWFCADGEQNKSCAEIQRESV